MIKISIVIPVYNVEDYIVECLKSLVAQTYQDNLECILVDDGSTDKSVEIINQFLYNYRSSIDFKLICHKHNKGQAAARNTGLNNLSGDYVFFMDSDDVLEPTCFELFSKTLNRYQNVDIVQASIITMEGKCVFSSKEYPDYTNNKLWIKKKFLLSDGIPPATWNRLIKKEIIVRNHISFHEGIIYEDVPFTFALGQYADSIAFINEFTYRYRIHQGSTVTSSNDMRALPCRIIVLDDLLATYNNVYPLLQIRAIMLKYMLYINIHSYTSVKSCFDDFISFQKKFLFLMPWYFKIIALFYFILPIKIQRHIILQKLFRCFFSVDFN